MLSYCSLKFFLNYLIATKNICLYFCAFYKQQIKIFCKNILNLPYVVKTFTTYGKNFSTCYFLTAVYNNNSHCKVIKHNKNLFLPKKSFFGNPFKVCQESFNSTSFYYTYNKFHHRTITTPNEKRRYIKKFLNTYVLKYMHKFLRLFI